MSEAMTDEQWKRILRYAEGTREMTDCEERLDILIAEVKRLRLVVGGAVEAHVLVDAEVERLRAFLVRTNKMCELANGEVDRLRGELDRMNAEIRTNGLAPGTYTVSQSLAAIKTILERTSVSTP